MLTTLISHIYNEEYLLPFWLEHHKNLFDDIVIIDYNSTDNSVEICKRIIPRCKIIQSVNKNFEAVNVDKEVMDIEKTIEGIKVVLNTTEFLFLAKPLKEIITINNYCIALNAIEVFCKNNIYVDDYKDFINKLLSLEVKYNISEVRIGHRFIHSYDNGEYSTGRHGTYNNIDIINDKNMYIIWCGYYPYNEKLIDRKLQIKNCIPESDRLKGYGSQHFYNEEVMYYINNTNYNNGKNLSEISDILYEIIKNI